MDDYQVKFQQLLRELFQFDNADLDFGIYHLANLDVGEKSRVWVTAPTEIRIANRLQPGEKAAIGPAPGSGLDATDLVFFIAGINGNSGNLGARPKRR